MREPRGGIQSLCLMGLSDRFCKNSYQSGSTTQVQKMERFAVLRGNEPGSAIFKLLKRNDNLVLLQATRELVGFNFMLFPPTKKELRRNYISHFTSVTLENRTWKRNQINCFALSKTSIVMFLLLHSNPDLTYLNQLQQNKKNKKALHLVPLYRLYLA